MIVKYCKRFSVPLVKAHPDHLFVFGDNLEGRGCGGQAIIRYEKNVLGIPTKRMPRTTPESYFSDLLEEESKVLHSLRILYRLGQDIPIVFPYDGIGTGLAKMSRRSPRIYAKMCDILQKHFGIRNGYGLDTALIEEEL